MEIKEGYMPFMGYQTYYRIVGKTEEGKSPIILLHGGPGSTHNYFELLDRVAESGRAVIMYDQLGCGNSFVEGHPELWTPETWLNELCVLIDYLHIDHFHLLGQSWGWHARHHLSDREASKGREVSHPQQHSFEQQALGK